MWESGDPFDDYRLVHLSSVAGDALVALALADSVFFSLPLDQARIRVALYLALTMAPLAVAAPLLVPLLDRSPFRRAISFAAGAGRAAAAFLAVPRVDSVTLFPAAFVLLVLSRVHGIVKNGLTAEYAPAGQGLVAANARLGRLAAAGAAGAVAPGFVVLKLGGPSAVLGVAGMVYVLSAVLNVLLARPGQPPPPEGAPPPRGRLAELATAAAGTAGLRAAQGFLLFLLAFALRRADNPASWLAVLIVAGTAGAFLADLVAPRLPQGWREEGIVLWSLVAAGGAALVAFAWFSLPALAAFAAAAGAAAELGRLSFQSLMQRLAPAGAQGRVFARYEVVFQLSWVAGAFLPAMLPIPFRAGVLALAAFSLLVGATYLARPHETGRS